MEINTKLQTSILKILAVVGAVSILSLTGFLAVTVISNAPNIIGSIKAQVVNITQTFIPAERIVLTVNNNSPLSGDVIKISFEHISKGADGSYSFFYECKEGVYFEKVANFKPTGEIVFCNTPYNFNNIDNTFSVAVFSKSKNSEEVEVPISINFVRVGSDRISKRGSTTLSVLTEKILEEVFVPRNNTVRTYGSKTEETTLINNTQSSSSKISNPSGVVDLKPRIIAVGQIDRATNVFTATTTISGSSRGAVKFEVENVGTKISPDWTFNVVLPTFPSYIYHSKIQQALLPGDRIEYTIGFDSIRTDDLPNTIVVNVDPISSVKESDDTNNIVKSELKSFK
jgi:hypothetical protein